MFGRLTKGAASVVLVTSAALISVPVPAAAMNCTGFTEYVCVPHCDLHASEYNWYCWSNCGANYLYAGECYDSEPWECSGEPAILCTQY